MKKRFSLGLRLLGSLCVALFVVGIVWVLVAGVSFASGGLVAAALIGVATPCALGADTFTEGLVGIMELVTESFSTLIEGIVDFVSSLF